MNHQQYFPEILPIFQKKYTKITKKGKIFVYFDFDGTLAPIVADPDKVKVNVSVIDNLEKLSGLPAVMVSIISGRELKFMQKYFRNRKILLVGSHGSEMKYGDLSISRNEILPTAERIHRKIDSVHSKIIKVKGALIESKKFGVALHYRQCDLSGKKEIRKLARNIVRHLPDAKLTILRGKQVAEINPKIGWTKGRAIEDIRRRFADKNLLEIYIGDDISDESAFGTLNSSGQYSVRVRKRKTSKAKYFLKSQKDVEALLNLLTGLNELSK